MRGGGIGGSVGDDAGGSRADAAVISGRAGARVFTPERGRRRFARGLLGNDSV